MTMSWHGNSSHYWPSVRGIDQSPKGFPHWGTVMWSFDVFFFLWVAWRDYWTHSLDAGDLTQHDALAGDGAHVIFPFCPWSGTTHTDHPSFTGSSCCPLSHGKQQLGIMPLYYTQLTLRWAQHHTQNKGFGGWLRARLWYLQCISNGDTAPFYSTIHVSIHEWADRKC